MGTLRKMRRKSGRVIHKTKGHHKRARLTKRRRSGARRSVARKSRRHYGKSKRRKRRGGFGNPLPPVTITPPPSPPSSPPSSPRVNPASEPLVTDSSPVDGPMNPVSMGQMPDDDASDE